MTQASEGQRRAGGASVARRWGMALIVAGGALSALNGAAHIALPVIYPWEQHVEGLYEPVRWALFATTAFFAVLLTLCGLLSILVVRAPDMPRRLVAWVAAGMAAFWILGAVYELVVPFPAPVAEWVLPAFSVSVALMYGVGLWLWLRPQPGVPAGHPTQRRTRSAIPSPP